MNRSNNLFNDIAGYCIDLDGVLYIGRELIPGAKETVAWLRDRNFPIRFVTNTTTKSLATLQSVMDDLGIDVRKDEIISAPQAAVIHLREMGGPSCFLCMNDDVKHDFAGFTEDDQHPDVVVVGDINDRWHYDLLNRMFRMLIDGAELIALHKGRFWHEPDGLYMDIGAFVSALEYSSGKNATIIGKPNRAIFDSAVSDLGLPANKVAMIGDDIDSDVGGAQKAGLKGILAKTGKHRDELAAASSVTPDAVIDSIAGLPTLIANRR